VKKVDSCQLSVCSDGRSFALFFKRIVCQIVKYCSDSFKYQRGENRELPTLKDISGPYRFFEIKTIEPRLNSIEISDTELTALVVDGRRISVPLAWSWRLSEATMEQRQNYEIIGNGQGVHWPDIDEDISVEGMLFGVPARR